MKFNQFGWVVAAALGATMFAGGFQVNSQKIGVVDMAKVFGDSEFAKKQSEQLKAFGNARSGILEFLETYRAFTPEQAARFRELSLKANASAAEKAEVEKIKQDVMAADKKLKALQQKT